MTQYSKVLLQDAARDMAVLYMLSCMDKAAGDAAIARVSQAGAADIALLFAMLNEVPMEANDDLAAMLINHVAATVCIKLDLMRAARRDTSSADNG